MRCQGKKANNVVSGTSVNRHATICLVEDQLGRHSRAHCERHLEGADHSCDTSPLHVLFMRYQPVFQSVEGFMKEAVCSLAGMDLNRIQHTGTGKAILLRSCTTPYIVHYLAECGAGIHAADVNGCTAYIIILVEQVVILQSLSS